MTAVLAAHGVRLTYPGADTPALDGVDLEVGPGECVGLLGPNGAGKTTLVKCATGLLDPDQGTVGIVGGNPTRASTRRWLGVMLQETAFPRHLSVRELVVGAAVRAGHPATDADVVLAEVGLTDLARRRTPQLSGGQRQRLQLARALVTDPALLVLDEPTTGLDGDSRRQFWDNLAARRDAGMAILLTTHAIEEVGAVADRVVVIAQGRVVADETPQTLTDRLPDRTITARTELDAAAVGALPGVVSAVRDGEYLRIATARPEDLLRDLLARDPELHDLRVQGASLEEVVVALSGGAVIGAAPAAATPAERHLDEVTT